MNYYAHTDPKHPSPCDAQQYWEPLYTQCLEGCSCNRCGHLNQVAWLAARFAEGLFSPGSTASKDSAEWGRLAGLWHDLGKFPREWQAYLKSRADIHAGDLFGKMDHATAGAVHARARSLTYGTLLAYLIAGHHSGLADGVTLRERLRKPVLVDEARQVAQALELPLDSILPPLPLTKQQANSFTISFFVRLLFSCLVDADFLATEAFMNPEQAKSRARWSDDVLARMNAALVDHLAEKESNSSDTPVNRERRTVREACLAAAEKVPGTFTLTVPTGGGKTLSSLAFALKHALKYGLRRVIYVIPYTSIIEQNAEEFRNIFSALSEAIGQDLILEHHSNLDPDKETTLNRLPSENWDVPLIVTTNVQFFESLFASRTSRCRKLHRIVRSVVIFDEAQSLPVHLLAPCLAAMKTLSRNYETTLLLCTATQPALTNRSDFDIGFDRGEVREIIPDPPKLFRALRRTIITSLGKCTDQEIVSHFRNAGSPSALFVVNLRRHARALFEQLEDFHGTYHLSAQMCPIHRSTILEKIRERLNQRLPVVLVATRLVEAGVDISFPLVYRAEGGLDSLAQAAGRCNRHGDLRDGNGTPVVGHVYSFTSADFILPDVLKEMQDAAFAAKQLEGKHRDDLLGLEAIEEYFRLHYWERRAQTDGWDKPPNGNAPILSNFSLGNSEEDLFFSLL